MHAHAESPTVAGDNASDTAIAVDPESLPAQRVSDADLPFPGPERRHLLRDLSGRRKDQSPGKLGRRIGRRAGVQARRHHDAQPGTGGDINVGVDASLADEFQLTEPLEQWGLDLRPFPYENQRFGVLQTVSQLIEILGVVIPDFDVVVFQLLEAGKRAESVVVVIQDGDLHSGR
ncbi:MAG: hypothetical protein R2724_19915 [Bryobacterales bacterium]